VVAAQLCSVTADLVPITVIYQVEGALYWIRPRFEVSCCVPQWLWNACHVGCCVAGSTHAFRRCAAAMISKVLLLQADGCSHKHALSADAYSSCRLSVVPL
jgi:hypothetical protein